MAFTGPVEDRLAIRELVATYGDAVFRRNAEEWGGVWADDGVWCLPQFPGLERVEGKQKIVELWSAAIGEYPFMVNIQTLGALEVKGDTATGRTYTHETVRTKAGGHHVEINLYHDEFVKRNGRWYIKSRTLEILDKLAAD